MRKSLSAVLEGALDDVNTRVKSLELAIDEHGFVTGSPKMAKLSDEELGHSVGLLLAYRAWFGVIKSLPAVASDCAMRDIQEHNKRANALMRPKEGGPKS